MPRRYLHGDPDNVITFAMVFCCGYSAAIGAGNPATWEAGHQSMRVYGR
jgi:hypothetical protein